MENDYLLNFKCQKCRTLYFWVKYETYNFLSSKIIKVDFFYSVMSTCMIYFHFSNLARNSYSVWFSEIKLLKFNWSIYFDPYSAQNKPILGQTESKIGSFAPISAQQIFKVYSLSIKQTELHSYISSMKTFKHIDSTHEWTQYFFCLKKFRCCRPIYKLFVITSNNYLKSTFL